MSRFWTGAVRVVVGAECTTISLNNGVIASVTDTDPGMPPGDKEVVITAPPESWGRMLEPTPAPMYQDIHSAAAHHGVEVGGDELTKYQYYPALRRFLELARDAHNGRP